MDTREITKYTLSTAAGLCVSLAYSAFTGTLPLPTNPVMRMATGIGFGMAGGLIVSKVVLDVNARVDRYFDETAMHYINEYSKNVKSED